MEIQMDSDNLMQALYDMDWEKIKTELNSGADVNTPYNQHGWTPFMWACKDFYEPEVIEAFLKAGGNVNQRNQFEETPFIIAAKHRSSPQTLAVLLAAGADINARDKSGNTAFVYIAKHPQVMMRLPILDFMIDNGANPNIKNKQGKTVWDYAAEREGLTDYLCVRLLEESNYE